MKSLTFLLLFILLMSPVYSQNSKQPMKDILSEYTFKTHTVTLNNLEISYIKEGSGEQTLVFVHGLSSNAEAWSKNISILKEQYTCVALDLPGYGKSSKPEAEYTPTYFAAVVSEFIEALKLQNVVLVGHSMGGQASIKLAVTEPKRISKLILIAPAGLELFSETNAAVMKSFFNTEMVKNTSDKQIENNYALNFYEQPKEVDKMVTDRKAIREALDFEAHCEAIVKSILGMLNDPVHNDLKTITQPTLIVFGNQDKLIPNRYFNPTLTIKTVGEIAKDAIENTTIEYVENAGHFVQFEKPEAVNAAIQKVLGSEIRIPKIKYSLKGAILK